MQINEWPPKYTLKKHVLAKRIKLRVSARKGLEVITPLRFNIKKIPLILEQNRLWIEKQFAGLVDYNVKDNKQIALPQQIFLPAINQTWYVSYVQSDTKFQLLTRPHQGLVMMGDIHNTVLCQKSLVKWLKRQAKAHLLPELTSLSHQLNLPITKMSIRDQQTRWGSCSSKKAISLNYKLIFLPHHLVKHTLIHELCHTVHMNHSEKFWQLVASFDPNWQQYRKELRKANAYIPNWLPQ